MDGSHTAQGINFVLPHDVAATPTAQANWRFCQKCNAMFYDGYPDKGNCPAGGGHTAQGFNFNLPIQGALNAATQMQAGDLNAATQIGTYENIDAAAVVRDFHQGKSGIELLGGLSRGYMRWLEILGRRVRESSGPPPGVKPAEASLPWMTYSERPKLVVVRQGRTFPIAGGASVRNYILEIWWLPADDTEYKVIAGHAGRAELGDQIGYGIVMRPFAGDTALFEQMKRELAAMVVAAATQAHRQRRGVEAEHAERRPPSGGGGGPGGGGSGGRPSGRTLVVGAGEHDEKHHPQRRTTRDNGFPEQEPHASHAAGRCPQERSIPQGSVQRCIRRANRNQP